MKENKEVKSEGTASVSLLHKLESFSGARHKMKRLGRGKSSGHGGTSTKGHKGQRCRSGFGLLRGFEGGQMPLVRLLPKFGFTNIRFKTKYDIVNVSDLNRFDSEVNPATLYEAGLAGKKSLVKILAEGKLDKPLQVKAHRFSQKAIKVIEKAGGKAETLSFSNKTEEEQKTEEKKKTEEKTQDNTDNGNITQ